MAAADGPAFAPLQRQGITITLPESPDTRTAGMGEATEPALLDYAARSAGSRAQTPGGKCASVPAAGHRHCSVRRRPARSSAAWKRGQSPRSRGRRARRRSGSHASAARRAGSCVIRARSAAKGAK